MSALFAAEPMSDFKSIFRHHEWLSEASCVPCSVADVTEAVNGFFDEKHLRIKLDVNEGNMGGVDPAPGKRKTLKVSEEVTGTTLPPAPPHTASA